jgi:hypothetical protein
VVALAGVRRAPLTGHTAAARVGLPAAWYGAARRGAARFLRKCPLPCGAPSHPYTGEVCLAQAVSTPLSVEHSTAQRRRRRRRRQRRRLLLRDRMTGGARCGEMSATRSLARLLACSATRTATETSRACAERAGPGRCGPTRSGRRPLAGVELRSRVTDTEGRDTRHPITLHDVKLVGCAWVFFSLDLTCARKRSSPPIDSPR